MAIQGETGSRENPTLDQQRPVPTGGLIVLLNETADFESGIRGLLGRTDAGVETHSLDNIRSIPAASTDKIVTFPELNAAIVPGALASNRPSIRAAILNQPEVVDVIPEFYLFTRQFADTAQSTWGIQATGALDSPFTGDGIKLAILDTGIDLSHPDYQNRPIVSKSFVAGETIDDVQGHGTHCAGTAAGHPANPAVPRYGVAPGASLHVGKVLNNRGFGTDQDIINGIFWAINEGCEVISMSLGAPVRPGEQANPLYERAGRLALQRGSLIIAAAGNESNRGLGYIAPVGRPANSQSIMAVAAVNGALDVASFSNGSINPDGGGVDIAGPGVGVFSSVPVPQTYATLMGTSMACPHVAGCAALWAQSDPTLRGDALWQALVHNARPLSHSGDDVGAGLVQAPIATGQALV